jgi:hypothetical protein
MMLVEPADTVYGPQHEPEYDGGAASRQKESGRLIVEGERNAAHF